MWVISLRDLEYRSRRFLIALAVTALVFGIAVAIDGIKRTLQEEPEKLVASFGADAWVVRSGNSSPFTTTSVLPESILRQLTDSGVRRAVPVVTGRATVTTGTRTNVNIIGYTPRGGAGPDVVAGHLPQRPGEAMVGDGLDDVGVGDTLRTTTGTFDVVGLVDGERYNAGAPTIFTTLAGAQRAVLDGQRLLMGVAISGRPQDLPRGTSITSNDAAAADLRLTIESATKTIDFVALLSWLIAAGVIGAIVYLTAIERTRDFAVLRATGSSNRTIVGGLMAQSLLLAILAALLSVPLALVLRLGMPLPSTLSPGSLVKIVLVGIVVGVLSSLAAVRRALTTDPALAFGGA